MAGCAALAVAHGYCAVHDRGIKDFGTLCDKCKGTGVYFYLGQNLTMACQHCGGVGVVDRRRPTLRLPKKKDREPIDQRGLITAAKTP